MLRVMKAVVLHQPNAKPVLFLLPAILSIFIFLVFTINRSASPTPPTSSAPAAVTTTESEPQQKQELTRESLLAEVNKRRTEAGVAPLQMDERLNQSAQAKCDDMVVNSYYDHVSPIDGSRGYDRAHGILQADGKYSENLLRQLPDTSSKDIFDAWFKSAPHKESALNVAYAITGFGICGKTLIVQHFFGS